MLNAGDRRLVNGEVEKKGCRDLAQLVYVLKGVVGAGRTVCGTGATK